jgi:hypothetical protein
MVNRLVDGDREAQENIRHGRCSLRRAGADARLSTSLLATAGCFI